ncbi:MAG: hypothetical protein ACK5AZ_17090 [Bryobacteraceae bacterium]
MKLLTISLLLVGGLHAQDAAPAGLLKGRLLIRSGNDTSGVITLRTMEYRVYRCHFDEKTLVQNERQRIAMDELRAGDDVEVLTDRDPESGRCYVRSIRLTPPPLLQSRRPPGRSGSGFTRLPLETILPRGNLTYAGIVIRVSDERLVLKTRSDGHKTIVLRSDTRFSDSGIPSDVSSLPMNRHVFVRAGRNIENQIEAYFVAWGDILRP